MRGEGIILDLDSCLKKLLRKNELNKEKVIDRKKNGEHGKGRVPLRREWRVRQRYWV